MPSTSRRTASSFLALAAVLAWASSSQADVDMVTEYQDGRAVTLFSEHMILQRDTNAPIWGKADPGEMVSVEIAGQTKMTTADVDGMWRVELDPVAAGGPYEMVVTGNNTIVLDDILFGDVWVMAGQSNLMILRPWANTLEMHPEARVFKRTWSDRPGGMTFNFARVMSEELGVPVGVLQRCMRGSSGLVRTWLGPDAASSVDPVVVDVVATGNFGQSYAAQIKSVEGFAIKGIIWWQGESDTRSRNDPGEFYAHMLPAIIESWRSAWNRGPIPFLFLQEPVGGGFQGGQLEPTPLPDPNYTPQQSANFRQAFIRALALEQTQIITSADLVSGLHPKDREGYLQRIKAAVLGYVYGYDITYAGPTYQGMTIEAGNHVRIRFRDKTARGLNAVGGPLQGFSISGDGVNFEWANAVIEGEEVVVWSDSVPTPTLVRYGYHKEFTFANLFNDAGMGCPTFTTNATPFE